MCGDGAIEAGVEECDDGNDSNTDACVGDCKSAVCGDTFVREGVEECDDGNASNTDDCVGDCKSAICGDAFVWDGVEACDDGNAIDTDGCVGDCKAATCGDGLLFTGMEQCDDANATLCDGCETCEKRHSLSVPAKAFAMSSSVAAGLSVTGAACYELWAKASGSVSDTIYLSSTATGTQSHFILRCQPTLNKLQFAVENGSPPVETVASIPCGDNAWHHVAGCRSVNGNSVTLTLYWDGTQVATAPGPSSKVAAPAAVYIGGVTYGQDGIGGVVDEVRISKSLRYTGNFTPERRFTKDADTVALYHLDDGAGTTLKDASGNGYDGTLTGTTWVADAGYKPIFCQ